MARATADRPLTDPQERALIKLGEGADSCAWIIGWRLGRANTLEALEHRGLVESQIARRLDFEYRITDAGRAMLASMGD